MRKVVSVFIVLLLCTLTAFTQMTPITGQIRDEKGDPVPFSTVKLKGSKTAVAADQNGNFKLDIPKGSVLVITAAGFEQMEMTVGNESTVSVLLKSQSSLNEVIITALGIQRQAKDLGYSTTRIKNAELTQGRAVNLQNGLTGKVSGLNITTVNSGVFEETKIVLRGIRSLTGNNQPLLVVDGIPTPLTFISTINPNDIQEVTILKGASGAAIYGPDGVNGVILVSTRRGTNGQPTVTISHTAQLARVSFLPKLQKRFGSGSGATDFGEPGYIPFENQQFGPEFNGQMVQLGKPLEDGSVQMVPYSYLENEKKKFWNNGLTLQTDVSFTNKDFYLSAQDVEIKGLTPKDKNRRTSLRFNAAKEYGKLRASFNVNYIQGNSDVLNNSAFSSRFASSYNGSVYFTVLNTPGQVPLTSYKDPNNKYGQYSNYYNEYFVSPYWVIDNQRTKGRADDFLGSAKLEYNLANWLNVTYRLGSSLDFYSYKNTNAAITVSDYAAATRGAQYRNQPGSVGDGNGFSSRITHEFFFNGKKDIGDFGVSYILGTRYRQNNSKSIDIAGNNLVVPGLYNVSNRSGEATAFENNFRNRLFSVFGQVGFNYKNWANIEFSAANDWDSRLYLNDNSKVSFFYPSVDASIVLSDVVPFLIDNSFISFAKIRGSLSKSANVNLGTYALEATYSQTGGFAYGNLGGFSAGNIKPDVGIQPEFVNGKEVGIELGFLRDRINLDVTYFHQKNTNQILTVQQSWATGYPARLANTADFNNYGVEMDLNISPLFKIGDGKFNFKIEATYNDNKITSLFPGINELNIGGVENFTQRAASSPQANNYAIVGQPAFVFKLSDYKRDPQGHVIVDRISGNPKLSDSLVTRGRTLPLWILGFNPSFSFKGLTIGMTVEYRGGNYLYSGLGSDMDFTGISERSAQFDRKRFVFPNSVYFDGSKYVQNDNIQVSTGGVNFWTSGALNSSVATNYFASAAFWKLRELSIAYELPSKMLGKSKIIKRASVALVGRNLLTFIPKSNQWTDPEFNYTSLGNTFGISNVFSTPPSRLYGGSITLTF